jgi:hypothetical protein
MPDEFRIMTVSPALQNRLNNLAAKHGLSKLSIFPGTDPGATDDQVVAAVEKAIVDIASGDYEEVQD